MPRNATYQDNSRRTRPHREVEQLLDRLRQRYESERWFPPYTVDVFLPEYHAAIEVDGPNHSRRHDRQRDAALMERYGLAVLHVSSEAVGEPALEAFVTQFIQWAAPSAEQRRAAWQR